MSILAGATTTAAGVVLGSGVWRAVSTAVSDASGSSTDPLQIILNGGVLGAVVLLFLTGQLTTGREVKNVTAERDRAQQELTALRSSTDDKVLPALIRVTDLVARLEEDERRRRRGDDP